MNALLHLSDIHMGTGREPCVPTGVVAALRGLNIELSTLVLVVTGDVAYLGQTDQYLAATAYFSELRRLLAEEVGAEVQMVVCPGNHDCCFPEDTGVRDLVVKDIRSLGVLPASQGMVEQCTSVQVPFFEWLRDMHADPAEGTPCLAWVKEIICRNGVTIAFRVLNTAWMSTRKEVQGGLFFPPSAVPDIPRADVRVTLLHHPYAWFQSVNGRELRRTLDEGSDLVLTGHEHDYDEYCTVRTSDEPTGYVEGGCFTSEKEKHCVFNIIQIDSQKSRYAVTPFSLCGDRFSADTKEPGWHPYVCTSSAIVPRQSLSEETRRFLEDPGLQLTHRAKAIVLEDVFVPPDLRTYERSNKAGAMATPIVPSRLTINTLLDDRYVYLLGEGQSGKTSLAKVLFLHAIRRGLTPVFLSGSALRKADKQQTVKAIDVAVGRQYARLSVETFWQSSNETRVVLIDDFAESPLNASGRSKVIAWLKQKFGRAYLLGGDLTQVEELVALPQEEEGLHGFKRYEIRPFGHLLRDVLIEKWITLGQEDFIEPSDLQHQLRRMAETVSRTLGDSLLPANPVYIVMLLQQLEAEVPLDTRSGSYGYFYEAVLTLALQQTSHSAEDVDAKYTYLSELAWHLHGLGERQIAEEDLDRFTRGHIDRFHLNMDPLQLRQEILDSRVLQMWYGKYRFVYRYFFYYFIARYMRDNFDDADVQSCVDCAVGEIYREDFANILIFLTYLTKNKGVICRVLDQSKALFQRVDPCNLIDHVAFIGRLQDSVPAIVLPDGDPKRQRRSMLAHRDAAGRNRPQAEDKEEARAEESEDGKEVNEFLSINRAIKTLQVLGQILRNFSGSLRSETKLEITRECFDLALRVFNSFCTSLERHLDTTLVALADLFGKNFDELPERQRVPTAKKFIFFVTEVMCLATLRRISHAVGSETLVRTYEQLEDSYNTRATRFVQLSLRLDHFRRFPEKRILNLIKEVGDDVFGLTLLRMLVAEHFYLFERPYKTRQSISQKLGISYQRTLGPAKARVPGRSGEK